MTQEQLRAKLAEMQANTALLEAYIADSEKIAQFAQFAQNGVASMTVQTTGFVTGETLAVDATAIDGQKARFVSKTADGTAILSAMITAGIAQANERLDERIIELQTILGA